MKQNSGERGTCLLHGLELSRDCNNLFISVKLVYAVVPICKFQSISRAESRCASSCASAEFWFSGLKANSRYVSKLALPGVLSCCLLDLYINHLKCYLSRE